MAVEYDSDAEHTGSDRIHHDSVRRNRLTSGNITVLTYTNDQFKSWQETQQFAIQLASLLKWNVRTSRFETTQHTIDLRKFLFGSEY